MAFIARMSFSWNVDMEQHPAAVQCGPVTPMLGGVGLVFWLTGKLGRAWVGAWVHGMVHGIWGMSILSLMSISSYVVHSTKETGNIYEQPLNFAST